MKKDKLIALLQKIDGDPEISIEINMEPSSGLTEDIDEFRSLYVFDSIHLDLVNRRVILTNIVEWQGETT